MKPDPEFSHLPAEDRAALREELARTKNSDRVEVFDALNREADQDEDLPEMPESLRDQLVEQLGDRAPSRAAAAPAELGLVASVIDFFKSKPLVGYGGLAAAACAVMFIMLQAGGIDDTNRKIDTVRGGGDARPTKTADVPIYFFPKSEAAEVIALMDRDRKIEVVENAEALAPLVGEWGVIVDLEKRVLTRLENGQRQAEIGIEGDDPRGVLLGIRKALDEMLME